MSDENIRKRQQKGGISSAVRKGYVELTKQAKKKERQERKDEIRFKKTLVD